MLNILFIGDIVGSNAVKYLKAILPDVCRQYDVDLVIANAENAAGGLGLTPNLARSLHEAGVHVMTLGNHAWAKWEIADLLEKDQTVLRPANGHPDWPGARFVVVETGQIPICIISLMGQYGLNAAISPFIMIHDLLGEVRDRNPGVAIVVDMHAEATAEKLAMLAHLDGHVAAVLGTHTHVVTADERVTALGTAYITDVGMTGPKEGIIGMSKRSSLRRFVDQLPARYELADGLCMLNAVLFCLDHDGLATGIERIYLEEEQK